MLIIENDLYKDAAFKSMIGLDVAALTRQVRRDEQIRKAKIAKIANYDPLFDAANLNENEKIVVRRVKKIVERMNSKGEMVQEEIEVDEEIVINTLTGEEVRKREKEVMIS